MLRVNMTLQRRYQISADWHQNAMSTSANEHDAVRHPDQAAARAACASAASDYSNRASAK